MTERPDAYGGESSLDGRVRGAAFAFLAEQTQLRGEHLPRGVLVAGFQFEGRRVPLLGPQGIFKPALLQIPLSVTTVPVEAGKPRPYDDEVGEDGLIRYRFRGTDPNHRDNVGLRLALERRLPLIYFFGIVPGEYLPVWPVFVVAEDRQSLAFHLAVDIKDAAWEWAPDVSIVSEPRREYVTQLTLRRLHQEAFRVRVMHHAAVDRNILGIRPDLMVEIREDILREQDGPMLTHGLQGFQGSKIVIPRPAALQPAPDLLAERYEIFRKAS